MNPIKQFFTERREAMKKMSQDKGLRKQSLDWMIASDKYKYTYNYTWLGRPIIKYPSDIVVTQEIIWKVKPDLIIETGIAHGGSLMLSASMLEMLGGDRKVVGIDVDIRGHNREAIEEHRMYKRIEMIEGSSTAPEVVDRVKEIAKGYDTVMVFLDSLHTHAHVLDELRAYAPIVSVGSYMVLPDTFIEYFPKGHYSDRPWDVGDNPMTALKAWLEETSDFEIDQDINDKLMITEAFDGYLLRVK